MDISLVIPVYNEEKVIRGVLDSLCKQEGNLSFEAIFVDHDSTDKTVQIINEYKDKIPNLKVINESKKGIGVARNTGCRLACGKIIACSDADVVLPSNWFKYINKMLNEGKWVALVGTYAFSDRNKFTNWLFRIFMIFFDRVHFLIHHSFAFRGLNFAVLKDAYEKAGGFNKEISALEDVELSFRVAKIGKIKYCPNFIVKTGYRRFEGRFFKQLIKRIKAYFFRAILKNNKESDWEVIR